MIRTDKNISAARMAEILKVSKRTILRDLDILKEKEKIRRIGSEKSGYWEITN